MRNNTKAGAVSVVNMVINQLKENVVKIKKEKKIMMRKKKVNPKNEGTLWQKRIKISNCYKRKKQREKEYKSRKGGRKSG